MIVQPGLRDGYVVWRVTKREAPRLWVITGRIATGASRGTITYRLGTVEGGTEFEREFVYAMPSQLLKLLDILVVRRRIQAESALAVRQLQARLENRM